MATRNVGSWGSMMACVNNWILWSAYGELLTFRTHFMRLCGLWPYALFEGVVASARQLWDNCCRLQWEVPCSSVRIGLHKAYVVCGASRNFLPHHAFLLRFTCWKQISKFSRSQDRDRIKDKIFGCPEDKRMKNYSHGTRSRIYTIRLQNERREVQNRACSPEECKKQ